jgi:hypothetical protein
MAEDAGSESGAPLGTRSIFLKEDAGGTDALLEIGAVLQEKRTRIIKAFNRKATVQPFS